MGLRLDDMWSFVVVAHLRSFTEAAAVCHLSQPGISARIVRLEKELGRNLFDRRTRPVSLTPAGRRFLPVAVSVIDELSTYSRTAV